MAKASIELSAALRKAARNLAQGKPYQWGHMGSCNCGHLAQVLLNMDKAAIHQTAMEKPGDWSEQAKAFCNTSGMEMDQLIFGLFEKGLSTDDIMNLEYLKDPNLLALIPHEKLPLKHNKREDVILYLDTWAEAMERTLTANINLSELMEVEKPVEV